MIYSGNCRLGDLFANRREKGRPGLPTLSVTMNDGLVDRDELERKQETNLAPEEHLLVKPGDIAYNMMRMWQGAFGLVDQDALVSPAYIVLRPKDGIDPLFASYLFKTRRLAYLFWAYSYGLTDDRLRLYFRDFSRIPVSIPDKRSQQEIAQTLAAWDRAISISEQLAAENAKWKKQLIAELNIDDKEAAKQDRNRRHIKLRDVANVIVSNVDKKHVPDETAIALCNYVHVYYNRYLSNDVAFDIGTATPKEIERFGLRKGDIVITKDSEEAHDIGVSSYVRDEIPNLVCGYHLAIVRPKKDVVDGAFLSAAFSSHQARRHFARHSNGVTRFGLPISAIETLDLALPDLRKQRAIGALVLNLEARQLLQERLVQNLRRQRTALSIQLLEQKLHARRS